MKGPVIRLAIISGSKTRRLFLENQFLQLENFQVVYKGQNPGTNFKNLVAAKPNMIFLSTGDPNMFADEIIPERLRSKFERFLPGTKIIISTELLQTDSFVRKAIKLGFGVIDERLDCLRVAQIMRRFLSGEQPVIYLEPREHDLETYRGPRQKEVV